jgi:hypothetical protein
MDPYFGAILPYYKWLQSENYNINVVKISEVYKAFVFKNISK